MAVQTQVQWALAERYQGQMMTVQSRVQWWSQQVYISGIVWALARVWSGYLSQPILDLVLVDLEFESRSQHMDWAMEQERGPTGL